MSVVLFQRDGYTAFMLAASSGRLEVTRLLLGSGCQIYTTDVCYLLSQITFHQSKSTLIYPVVIHKGLIDY